MSVRRWYISGYRDPHAGLHELRRAARDVRALDVLRVPMHVPASVAGRRTRIVQGAFKLIGHLMLLPRILSRPRTTILVREFLTLPLLLVSPLLFSNRHRVWFLCQHNLAAAKARPAQLLGLRALARAGFRFVVYESVDDWKEVVGSVGVVAAVPLPLSSAPKTRTARTSEGQLRVGFVGAIRKEKSPEWALEAVLEHIESDPRCKWTLFIGTPDEQALLHWEGRAETAVTATYNDYLAALSSCEVILLPYDSVGYAYRTSGVLGEAVSAGCVVVAPCLPTLSRQVLWPAPVGVTYTAHSDLIAAVEAAAALSRSKRFEIALDLHFEARGPAGVKRALSKLVSSARS